MKGMTNLLRVRSSAQWLTDAIEHIATLHPEIKHDDTVITYLYKATEGELHPRIAAKEAKRLLEQIDG